MQVISVQKYFKWQEIFLSRQMTNVLSFHGKEISCTFVHQTNFWFGQISLTNHNQSGVFPHQQLTFFIPCQLVLQRGVVHLHVAAHHLHHLLHLLLLVLRWEVRRQLAHRRAALFFNFTPSQSPPSWAAAVSETER